MKLSFLTNPDLNVQEKMRFFADYFSFTNEYLGKIPEIPFDSSRSIVAKIIFQLETNLEKCPSYIENYFKQLYFFYPRTFTTKSHLFLSIEKQFHEMDEKAKTCKPDERKKCKVIWIKENPSFKINVKDLKTEYEEDLDKNLNSLFTFISCKHALKKHLNEIKYCTQNLVAEFRLNGHSKESVDTYINRILQKDFFPFPIEILTIKDNELKKKKEKQFLEDRNFKEQFKGLKNLIAAPQFQQGLFIFRIENCYLDKSLQKDFLVQIDKVTFISPHHTQLLKLRSSARESDKKNIIKISSRFFSKKNLLACINLNYEDKVATMKDGLLKVNQELFQLNLYLKTHLLLNNADYLFASSFTSDIGGGNLSYGKNKRTHVDDEQYQNAKNNSFEALRSINSKSKEQILYNENTFLRAFGNKEVSSYWLYIENLFWNTEFKTADKQQKKFCKILFNHLEYFKNEFLRSMASLFISDLFIPTELRITYEERKHIFNEVYLNNNTQFDIAVYKERVNNNLFNEMIVYYKDFCDNKQQEKWKSYFASLLLELYEYRNAELHSGRVNEYSKIKLTSILPGVISKVRWLLINTSKDNPNFSFQELIEFLSK